MSKDYYEIGYGKPPKTTQFKAGKSGNPKGRPRKSRDNSTLVNEELDAVVKVTENGVVKRLSLRRFIFKGLVNRAAKGDLRALQVLLKFPDDKPEEASFDAGPADFKLLDKFKAGLLRRAKDET